jgi:predicted amidohydrolase YtcJ
VSTRGRKILRGRIVTLDPAGTEAEAVVVNDGRIEAIGDAGLLDAYPDADVVNFEDRCVFPGFIDPHAHLEIGSRALATMVDCRAPRCRTVDDVLQTLRDHVDEARDGWLVAQANLFFDQKLADRRFPTKEELDSVSSNLAIVVRAGGHVSIINSKALELSDVASYAGRSGMMGRALIETDSDGKPRGIIGEIDKALPLPEPTREELKVALREGAERLFTRFGVTTVGEISETFAGIVALDELIADREVSLRTSIFLWAPGVLSLDEACSWRQHLHLRSDPDRFRIRGAKLFADGGYSARNAGTRRPYVAPYAIRPGSKGRINLTRRQIASALRQTQEAGLQLAVHANGERTQAVVCAGVKSAGSVQPGLEPRIEHAGNFVTDESTVEAWREAAIIPVPQPVFLYNFGDFLPVYLGPHGLHGRFPFRALIDAGWRISGSSDLHLGSEESQTNPLFSVWCCLARTSFLGVEIEPEQRITIDEALRMHTRDAAYTLGIENERGSIEVGKMGDFAVLDRDPRAVNTDQLLDIRVDEVLIGGETVFARHASRNIEQGKAPAEV